VPFLGCPNCPPVPMRCPRCGFHPIWVDPMEPDDFDDAVESHVESERKVTDLGEFKSSR